jgi:hypothetical protein
MSAPNVSLLFGRRTYQDFAAFWPKQADNPFTPVLDNRRKYVASRTVTEPLVDDLGLDGLHLFHAIRADLLRRLGRAAEAAEAYRGRDRPHQERSRARAPATQAAVRRHLNRRGRLDGSAAPTRAGHGTETAAGTDGIDGRHDPAGGCQAFGPPGAVKPSDRRPRTRPARR